MLRALKGSRFRPFRRARAFVRTLKLKGTDEWYCYCKGLLPERGNRPADIPASPWTIYKEAGWKGMGDWLGTGAVSTARKQWRPFEEARAFARSLGLKSQSEWRAYCRGSLPREMRRPTDVPSKPEYSYARKGWTGYGDWLGTDVVPGRGGRFRSFQSARAFVRLVGLKSLREWRLYCAGKLPEKGTPPADIPPKPNEVYKDYGWINYDNWLNARRGCGRKKRSKRT